MANQPTSKVLNIVLWIAQGLLAAMNLMAGSTKLSQPIDALAQMLPWVNDVPAGLVRFIGLSEVLGGLGLILPALLRIQPRLTPLAAIGLALVQLLAAVFHITRGETAVIGMNFVLMVIAGFIAWGRMSKAPILAK